MRTHPLAVTAIVLGLAAACQPAERESAELSTEATEAIEASSRAFEQAVLAGNWDAVAALYTEEAVLMPPNEPSTRGRGEIRAWFASLPPVESFQLNPEEIEGRGDLAYVRGTFSLRLSPPDAPGPIEDEGKYIEIRRRQGDGAWPISHDMFNSDQPPPTVGESPHPDTAAVRD